VIEDMRCSHVPVLDGGRVSGELADRTSKLRCGDTAGCRLLVQIVDVSHSGDVDQLVDV
jgi:hypothetical protein